MTPTNAMYNFQVSVHAQPEGVVPGKQVQLGALEMTTLDVPRQLMSEPFEKDFEDIVEAASKWERMYIEPDGSFVWVSPHGAPAWQVDGNLYDRNERLLFVDLKGSCPGEELDKLLALLGWPGTAIMFQLTQQAVFLAEAEFRQWAKSAR